MSEPGVDVNTLCDRPDCYLCVREQRCNCPGTGHDPQTCASTEGLCRQTRPEDRSMGRICGLPAGHDGECFA